MMSTPWQLGFVSTILRALARDDRAAMRTWVARPSWPTRVFRDRVAHIAQRCADEWCREALAPWGDDARAGGREFTLREQGSTTLARFAERGGEALVLVIVRDGNGDAKLEDVRVMKSTAFEVFGTPV